MKFKNKSEEWLFYVQEHGGERGYRSGINKDAVVEVRYWNDRYKLVLLLANGSTVTFDDYCAIENICKQLGVSRLLSTKERHEAP